MRSPTCVVLLAAFAAAAAALTGGAAAQKEPSAKDGGAEAADGVAVVYSGGQRLGPRRGGVENKHSTDVEAPPPAPHACVSIHHES